MRIVQLITQAAGGPVDHAVDVAGELARRGHDSHLIGPVDPGGALAERLHRAGVQVHRVECSGVRDVTGLREIGRTLRALSPDVLHCQDRRAGLAGRTPVTGRARPTVYTLHGVPDPFSHLVAGNLRAAPPHRRAQTTNMLGEGLLARAPRSLVVTPCEALADYARDHLRIPAHRVRTVHNGLGRAWLDRTTPPRPARDETVVVWLGLLGPVKRVPSLVEAVAAVPGTRLLLVGDGPERNAVERTVRRTGTGERVELLGFREDPAAPVAWADVMALPSAAEACPIALLQAMALGLAVVSSSVGGVPEIVRHGVDGLLVPAGDDRALREALTRLRDRPDLRRDLGASAARRVREHFTLEQCVDGLLDVYEEVAR